MIKKKTVALLFILISLKPAIGKHADSALLEKSIPENRMFIDFINIPLTNYATQQYLDMFKEAYKHDFNAHLMHLQGKLTATHKEILESQKILKVIYHDLLRDHYEPDTEKLLELAAPIILMAKDQKAEYYLKEGYRHLAKGKELRISGYNYNIFLYSVKIYTYIDALEHLKLAKKYAILALVESKTPLTDKADYALQSYDDALSINRAKEISDYDEIRYRILNALNRKLLPDSYPYLLHHDDNYGKIYGDKRSILYDTAVENEQSINSPQTQPAAGQPATTPAPAAPAQP